jgi:cytochrome c oxidase cbb3-type subunit III
MALLAISISGAGLSASMARGGIAYQTGSIGAKSLEGKQAFVRRCGVCHGLDGRGGEHAPAIATGAAAQLSDADVERIIRGGIPSKGMPSFKDLSQATVQSLIAYLRVLQGNDGTAAAKGDTSHGRALFFGTARCSECHAFRGEGGFLGPDLSSFSRSHSPEKTRRAIIDPRLDAEKVTDTVIVTTRDGGRLVGVARNEDNFSLQLQTLDGNFHLLMKSELASVNHDGRSLMPSDYGTRLGSRDLDDIVAFLLSAGASPAEPVTVRKSASKTH